VRKIVSILALALLATAVMPTIASAGAKKGQKIFKKKFRKKCGFSGVRFARNHTQYEWEEIKKNGKFKAEAKKICPRLDIRKIRGKWWNDVYMFTYKYARDGMVPKC